jgi:hypothetical protein
MFGVKGEVLLVFLAIVVLYNKYGAPVVNPILP